MQIEPRVVDDDEGVISVQISGKEVRGWVYNDEKERRLKIQLAHAYADGWYDGQEKMRNA